MRNQKLSRNFKLGTQLSSVLIKRIKWKQRYVSGNKTNTNVIYQISFIAGKLPLFLLMWSCTHQKWKLQIICDVNQFASESEQQRGADLCLQLYVTSLNIYQRNTVLEFHKLFKHTSLCVITDITSASTLQVTAATPRGTDCLSKHRIMILMLQLKCRRWCLDALWGWLLYLPFRLWRNVRAYAEL